MVALGQHSSPYRGHSPAVPGGEGHEDDSSPTLFAGPRPSGLFPVPKGEFQAGRLLPDPGDFPEDLG